MVYDDKTEIPISTYINGALCSLCISYVVFITLQRRRDKGVSEDVRKQVRVEEDLQLTLPGKNKFGKQNQLRCRGSVLVKLK